MNGATHIKPTFDPCMGRPHVLNQAGECKRCGIDPGLIEAEPAAQVERHAKFKECRGGDCLNDALVTVRVSAELSHTGEDRDKMMPVDACIAGLVEQLYPLTAASCCGHGQTEGRILLYDGRVLRIYSHLGDDGAMPDNAWGYTRS